MTDTPGSRDAYAYKNSRDDQVVGKENERKRKVRRRYTRKTDRDSEKGETRDRTDKARSCITKDRKGSSRSTNH